MSITLNPELETKLRARAEEEGLTIEAYLEHVVQTSQDAEDELQSLAWEGINSGEPAEVTSEHWAAKHRYLDERLKAAMP